VDGLHPAGDESALRSTDAVLRPSAAYHGPQVRTPLAALGAFYAGGHQAAMPETRVFTMSRIPVGTPTHDAARASSR